MYINSRTLRVLEFLKENNYTSIKDVAEKLSVTERVIRYDVDTINFLLNINNLQIIQKESKGKLIFEPSLVENKKIESFKSLNKYSKEERIDYIKARLLIEGGINLSAISKFLDISRTSIRKDLNYIVEELNKVGIEVENNQVCNDEKILRNYITKLYHEHLIKCSIIKTHITTTDLLGSYLDECLLKIDGKEVSKVIEEISEKIKSENKNCYEDILIYILTSYLRISNNQVVTKIKNRKFLKNSEEYKVLNPILDKLEKILEIKYTLEERLLFVDYIMGCLSYKCNTSIYEDWFEVVVIVKELATEIERYSGVSIVNDELLVEGLLNHIKPAIYRLKNNLSLEHDIYMDVIEPYPQLFNLIKDNLKKLEKLIDKNIPDSEIALITLHFLASIERNKNHESTNKNVLLVCGGGYGTSRLVAEQIQDLYNVNIVEVVYYAKLLQYDFSNVDIVITTLDFKDKPKGIGNIPIIKITPFLSIKDQRMLSKYLSENGFNKNKLEEILEIVNETTEVFNENKLKSKLEGALFNRNKIKDNNKEKRLVDFISLNKVRVIEKANDWKVAIRTCGEILIDSGDIKEEYIEEIIKIGEAFGVHFILENNIALPHGEVKTNIINSSISVLLTKDAVEFPMNKKAEIFFFIAAETSKDHVKSIQDIMSISKNEECINLIKNATNERELYDVLVKCFYKYIY